MSERKMVPRQPTPEMVTSAWHAWDRQDWDGMAGVWIAMFDAAPAPPEAPKCSRCDDTGCPECDPEWAQHQVPAPNESETHYLRRVNPSLVHAPTADLSMPSAWPGLMRDVPLSVEALCRQLRDLDPINEPQTTKQIGRDAAAALEAAQAEIALTRAIHAENDRLIALIGKIGAEKDAAEARARELEQLVAAIAPHWKTLTKGRVWTAAMAGEIGAIGAAIDAARKEGERDADAIRK